MTNTVIKQYDPYPLNSDTQSKFDDRMSNQLGVDWSTLPIPEDDGAADHLPGTILPSMRLPATNGQFIDLSSLPGVNVVYVYQRTARPDEPFLNGWDLLPGAPSCTRQSCAFRDQFDALRRAGVQYLFGLSSQTTGYQREAAHRLQLPFALLSDAQFLWADALKLPTYQTEGIRLLKRLTLIVRDGKIVRVFYPVFPPNQNAEEVLNWLANDDACKSI